MFRHFVTVAVAVAASQISMRYFRDPVANSLGTTTSHAAAGWSQLAFLRAQGQQGCLCCEDGVVHLPDAGRGVRVARWVPVDSSKKRNVTLPNEEGDDGKIIKEFYQKITVLATTAGEGSKQRWWAAGENDGYCVQACVG